MAQYGNRWVAAAGGEGTIFQMAISDETTDLTTGTGKFSFRLPHGFMLTKVRASVNTAPTGANIIVDINKNGVSVLSTKLEIDINEKTSKTSTTKVVISNKFFLDDDEITVDIDQVGSIATGLGLKVTLIGTKV